MTNKPIFKLTPEQCFLADLFWEEQNKKWAEEMRNRPKLLAAYKKLRAYLDKETPMARSKASPEE